MWYSLVIELTHNNFTRKICGVLSSQAHRYGEDISTQQCLCSMISTSKKIVPGAVEHKPVPWKWACGREWKATLKHVYSWSQRMVSKQTKAAKSKSNTWDKCRKDTFRVSQEWSEQDPSHCILKYTKVSILSSRGQIEGSLFKNSLLWHLFLKIIFTLLNPRNSEATAAMAQGELNASSTDGRSERHTSNASFPAMWKERIAALGRLLPRYVRENWKARPEMSEKAVNETERRKAKMQGAISEVWKMQALSGASLKEGLCKLKYTRK